MNLNRIRIGLATFGVIFGAGITAGFAAHGQHWPVVVAAATTLLAGIEAARASLNRPGIDRSTFADGFGPSLGCIPFTAECIGRHRADDEVQS